MLVGDYCPRALDPITEVIEAEKTARLQKPKEVVKKQEQEQEKIQPQKPETTVETKLPCDVFGTVDRCDGIVCEHDGNCFSGCCALFVGDSQEGDN